MEIKLEKDVPIPKSGDEYPLETMEVGESFVVTCGRIQMVRVFTGRLKDHKFVTRKIREQDPGYVAGSTLFRVW